MNPPLGPVIDALRPGNLVELTGLSATGKSLLALNLCHQMRGGVAIHSFETSNAEVTERLISIDSGRWVSRGHDRPYEGDASKLPISQRTDLFLGPDGANHWNVRSVERNTRKIATYVRAGLRLVVVDYAQLLEDPLDLSVPQLADLAAELSTAVLVIIGHGRNEERDPRSQRHPRIATTLHLERAVPNPHGCLTIVDHPRDEERRYDVDFDFTSLRCRVRALGWSR